MRHHTICTSFVAIAFLAGGLGATAQSLGEVARKEDARRKATQPGKVYTNKDLGDAPPASAPPSSSPQASATPDQSSRSEAADKAKGDASKAEGGRDSGSRDKGEKGDTPAESAGGLRSQAYWSDRLKQLQTQLDRDQVFMTALEARIAALNTDFVNRDDPAQRAVVAKDRQKSLEEVTRLKKAIDDDKKAITDLQEEARRAGVPPGWLR